MEREEYIRRLDQHIDTVERARLELDGFRDVLNRPPYSKNKNYVRGQLNICSKSLGFVIDRYRTVRRQLWDEMNTPTIADIVESELEEAIRLQGAVE